MNILLLGANGRTGREILHRALDAGHSVTAVVRAESRLADVEHPDLRVRVADPCKPGDLAGLVPGHDAVMSVLGPRRPWRSATVVYPESGAAIVDAMERSEVTRLLVTSSGLLFPGGGVFVRALRWLVGRLVSDARRMEDLIRASRLDWTIARTGFLTSDRDTRYRVTTDGRAMRGGPVPRAAVAEFLLAEAEQHRHRGQVVGLCG